MHESFIERSPGKLKCKITCDDTDHDVWWSASIDFFHKNDKNPSVNVKLKLINKKFGSTIISKQEYSYKFFKELAVKVWRNSSSADNFKEHLRRYHLTHNPQFALAVKQQSTRDTTKKCLDTWFNNWYPGGVEQCLRQALAYDYQSGQKFCYRN